MSSYLEFLDELILNWRNFLFVISEILFHILDLLVRNRTSISKINLFLFFNHFVSFFLGKSMLVLNSKQFYLISVSFFFPL